MNTTTPKSLIIFLHGVGSSGADFVPLAQDWRSLLPSTEFAAPDGPYTFDGGGPGWQWFSVSGVTEQNRPQRIVTARPAFDSVLDGVVAQHGFTNALDHVALVGFSQGSIMALDAVVSGRWPVAAVIAYSGRLASLPPFAPVQSTRVLAIHGAADPVIAASSSSEAVATLQQLGLDARSQILPGVGHTITAQGAQIGADFLIQALASGTR